MSYNQVSLTGFSRGIGATSDTITPTLVAGQRVLLNITKVAAEAVTGVTDNGGNTYTRLGTDLASGSTILSSWEAVITTNATIITVTYAAASTVSSIKFSVLQATGVDPAIAAQYVKQNQETPGIGSDTITSTSLTPAAQPGQLVGLTVPRFGNAITAGTGFNDLGAVPSVGNGTRMEDKAITATSAVATTFGTAANNPNATIAVYWQLTAEPVPSSYAVHSDIYF